MGLVVRTERRQLSKTDFFKCTHVLLFAEATYSQVKNYDILI